MKCYLKKNCENICLDKTRQRLLNYLYIKNNSLINNYILGKKCCTYEHILYIIIYNCIQNMSIFYIIIYNFIYFYIIIYKLYMKHFFSG